MHLLGVDLDHVYCSSLPFTEGAVNTAHGLLSVPAPATMRILTDNGAKFFPSSIRGELITPTGASLVAALCCNATSNTNSDKPQEKNASSETHAHKHARARAKFGPPPAGFTPIAIGMGAGTKDFPSHANVLRLIVGEIEIETQVEVGKEESDETEEGTTDVDSDLNAEALDWGAWWDTQMYTNGEGAKSRMMRSRRSDIEIKRLFVLETNLDDVSPQVTAFVLQRLLAAGACDVWTQAIGMKKSRAGTLLKVLCTPDRSAALSRIIFAETTTLGIRCMQCDRGALRRRMVSAPTAYGDIAVKVGTLDGVVMTRHPEYEECRQVAEREQVPLKRVFDAAASAAKDL